MPAKSSIGTTAVQLTTTSTPVRFCLVLRADPSNTGIVYVGLTSNVTANSADATDGMPLRAGESIIIPLVLVDDVSDVWVIGSASGQKVFWAVDLAEELGPAGSAGTTTASLTPATSGGWSVSRTLSAASTNATSVKGSAGQVGGWYLSNTNASPRFLKLYNKATAPTVGTDTPVMTIVIPGNSSGVGAQVEFVNGIAFSTGIAFALTTGIADADTGAVAANELVVNLLYK